MLFALTENEYVEAFSHFCPSLYFPGISTIFSLQKPDMFLVLSEAWEEGRGQPCNIGLVGCLCHVWLLQGRIVMMEFVFTLCLWILSSLLVSEMIDPGSRPLCLVQAWVVINRGQLSGPSLLSYILFCLLHSVSNVWQALQLPLSEKSNNHTWWVFKEGLGEECDPFAREKYRLSICFPESSFTERFLEKESVHRKHDRRREKVVLSFALCINWINIFIIQMLYTSRNLPQVKGLCIISNQLPCYTFSIFVFFAHFLVS